MYWISIFYFQNGVHFGCYARDFGEEYLTYKYGGGEEYQRARNNINPYLAYQLTWLHSGIVLENSFM